MVKKKKLLIVDDHPTFREGIKSIIARNPQLEIVGEAGEGKAALKLVENLRPDMVLLDVSLPDINGIDLIQDIRKVLPETRILMISMHSKIEYLTSAFQAGATGYVVKDAPAEKILQALDLVSRGEYFLDTLVARQIVKRLAELPSQQGKVTDAAYGSLTPREQEILRLTAEGQSKNKIADRLCISPRTVDNHRANLMAKLDLHSTLEMVRYAAKIGLIDVDHWKS